MGTVIAVIVVILLVAFVLMNVGLAFFATGIKRQSLDEAKKWQDEHYDTSYWDDLEKTEYEVTGYRGYKLHTVFVKNPTKPDSRRYVIISHGYTDNRFGDLKYLPIYLSQGFHCVIYDLRGHGVNGPSRCTYSVIEKQDLAALIQDTRERYGSDIILGLHGESLGAATTIACLGLKPDVQFAVADCGFADIINVMEGGLRQMHLPVWMVHTASGAARCLFGHSFSEARPIDGLKDSEVPVLYMHGAADDFIRPENSERMHEATKGYSKIHLFEGAAHAESVLKDPERYRRYVGAFIGRVLGATAEPDQSS